MRAHLSPLSPRSRTCHRQGGFTLIELLAAAAITALLAGFIIAIASNVSKYWTRTSGRLSTEAQARVVLDQLSLDLSSALYRDDGGTWMGATISNAVTGGSSGLWQVAAANPKPSGNGVNSSLDLTAARAELTVKGNLADARFGTGGVWLRFFTTKRGSNGSATDTFSAPVAVGYQIIRRFSGASTASTRMAYLFHRAEVRPVATTTGRPGVIESGYNIFDTAYQGTTAIVNNTGAMRGDPRSIRVPGSRTNFDSVIADNVIDFGIRCYVRDPSTSTGLRLIFPASSETGAPSTAAAAILRAQLPSHTIADPTNFNLLFPDVVDVMVRILTDEGARVINTYEQANSPLTPPQGTTAQVYWWQLAMANSQVFTRRIVINTKPL
jgi:prepilin-type N-terminal cleavage/methylation domain-containing protein